MEATHVRVSYPYQWRFNRVMQLIVPGATYAGVSQIKTDAVMQNLNYNRSMTERKIVRLGSSQERDLTAADDVLSRRFTSRRREQHGAEIVELALVLPVFFLVIFPILWFGLVFNIASTAQRAAKLGVQIAARPSCTLCGNNFTADAQVLDTINLVLNTDHLNPANLTSHSPPFVCQATPAPNCTMLQNVQICSGVPLTCGPVGCESPPAACGTNPTLGRRVSLGYRFNSPVPVGSWQAITIPASAQSPSEN